MRSGPIDAGFFAAPFVIGEIGVAGTMFRFGAHAAIGAARFVFADIGQHFVAVYAHEFAGWFFALTELAAEHGSERTTLHFPEFGNPDSGRVHF